MYNCIGRTIKMRTAELLTKFLLPIILFGILGDCSVISSTKAAHPDYPGKCYLKEPLTILSPGETSTLLGKCERAICGRNMDMEIHRCSSVVETKGCKITLSSPNRPYPECCPRIKC